MATSKKKVINTKGIDLIKKVVNDVSFVVYFLRSCLTGLCYLNF